MLLFRRDYFLFRTKFRTWKAIFRRLTNESPSLRTKVTAVMR